MSDNKYYIPKYIDEPFKVIIFTIDELVLIIIIMTITFLIGHEIIGLVASTILCVLYKKFKAKESSSFLKRYVYWHCNFSSRHLIPKAFSKKFKG